MRRGRERARAPSARRRSRRRARAACSASAAPGRRSTDPGAGSRGGPGARSWHSRYRVLFRVARTAGLPTSRSWIDDGGAVRSVLARLAAEVGATDLQGGGGPDGDRSRDAGAARHARGGQRDHLARGGGGARARVVQDDSRELRAARRGGGRPAEKGARGAGGRETRLLNRGQSFPNRSLES